MDVINISRSRRFLRERPIHVNLFDRPRLVAGLLCLEPGQEELHRGLEKSDSLLLVTEGLARLRAGPQIESLEEMDAVLVPPGQEYLLTNTGDGHLVALVIVTPKPSRADEVRVPGDNRPFRHVREEPGEGNGERPASTNGQRGRSGAPPRRDEGERAGPYRAAGAPQGSRYPRRDDARPGRPYPRRDDAGSARPYPRRDDAGAGRPYPRRDDGPARPFAPRRRDGEQDNRDQPRRGSTGARPPRRGEGDSPVWYPRSQPAWRPRGAPPAGAGAGRGRPAGARTTRDDGPYSGPPRGERGASARGPRAASDERGSRGSYGARGASEGRGAAGRARQPDSGEGRPARGTTGGERPGRSWAAGRTGESAGRGRAGDEARGGNRTGGGNYGRPPARGAGPRRNDGKKTGDARRASRGQGPLSGRRGPGRSGPRT